MAEGTKGMNNFNPETVKRVVGECDFGEGWYDTDVVAAEDYDNLLAMWRTQQESIRSLGGDVRAVANVLKARKL